MTAFSNGSEYEAWWPNWCGKCPRDELGTAPDGTFCSILGYAILENKVPPQWTPGTDNLRDRYHCSEFGTTPEPVLCFSQDGTVIHKVGCALAFGGRPWQTDRSLARQIATAAGWKPCEYCGPFK